MPIFTSRSSKSRPRVGIGLGSYRVRPKWTKLAPSPSVRPAANASVMHKYNKHFNSSNGLYKLALVDNTKARICYSCKSIFNSPQALVECIYKGTYNHQVFYCIDCGKGIMDAYLTCSAAMKAALEVVPTTTAGARFQTMNAWDLIAAYKKVPSCSILPFLFHEIKKLIDPNTGKLTRADQLKIMTAPIKIQQAVLKILDSIQFDTDLRNEMLLTVLRAFGKRRRAQDIRIHDIPMEVLRQLKTATLIRVLQNSNQSLPKTVVDEIAGKLFPEILKGGDRADDAKLLVTKLKETMQDSAAVTLVPSI